MLDVYVLSPEGTLYEGRADSVTLPGAAGRFTVLTGHAPIITVLEEGKVVCKSANGDSEFYSKGGFARVDSNKVTVCLE